MNSDNDNTQLVSLKDTVKLTSLSRTMINRYRASGLFPAAVALGERRIAFVRQEVQAWIHAKVAARVAA